MMVPRLGGNPIGELRNEHGTRNQPIDFWRACFGTAGDDGSGKRDSCDLAFAECEVRGPGHRDGSFTVNTAGAHCSPASCTSAVPYFDVTTTGPGSERFGLRYASYTNQFNSYPNVSDVGTTVCNFLRPE